MRKLHPYRLDEFGNTTGASDDFQFAISQRADHTAPSTILSLIGIGRQSRVNRRLQARQRLEALRRRFEAEDLAWRLQRRRLDQLSHEYWSRSNIAFAEAKEAAEQRARMIAEETKPFKTIVVTGEKATIPKEATYDPRVMEEFHRNWVEGRAAPFESYQREWVAGVFSQLKPAIRAVYRDCRWRLEVWRSGQV